VRVFGSERVRTFALRVTLVAASTMVAAALGEVVIRRVAPAYAAIQTDREMWVHDPILGWRIRPSVDVQQIFDRGRRVPVSINSHGFRERETQPLSGPMRVSSWRSP